MDKSYAFLVCVLYIPRTSLPLGVLSSNGLFLLQTSQLKRSNIKKNYHDKWKEALALYNMVKYCTFYHIWCRYLCSQGWGYFGHQRSQSSDFMSGILITTISKEWCDGISSNLTQTFTFFPPFTPRIYWSPHRYHFSSLFIFYFPWYVFCLVLSLSFIPGWFYWSPSRAWWTDQWFFGVNQWNDISLG